MLADEVDYMIGVDTHRDQHTIAVVVAPTGPALNAPSAAATRGASSESAQRPGSDALPDIWKSLAIALAGGAW